MSNSILNNNNNNTNVLQQIKQFKNNLKGNPKQAVMQMLQNGQLSQPQLQQLMQRANQFKGFFK